MLLQPETPSGLNHLVLNVRDMERAHHFWCGCLGFRHVATWCEPGPEGIPLANMRFYSGVQDGRLRHHDIALLERPSMPEDLAPHPQRLNHLAITYPSHAAWQRQIRFLIARGLAPFRQVERGATFSAHLHDPDGHEVELVYERPRQEWETDIQGAINRATDQPVGA